jgi:hypothetical protein
VERATIDQTAAQGTPVAAHIGTPAAGPVIFDRGPLGPQRLDPVAQPNAEPQRVTVEPLDVGGSRGSDMVAQMFNRPPLTSGRAQPAPTAFTERAPGE